MKVRAANPFTIVKASDFSDQEIENFWVDLPGGDGFKAIAKPASRMPMIILGGKGSGKTHLMRYYSYPLQKIRHKENVLTGIAGDGYIGFYTKCSGLNSHRFSGKNFDDDLWANLFSYYFDIWLSQSVLNFVSDIVECTKAEIDTGGLCCEIADLLSCDIEAKQTLGSVIQIFRDIQRQIDHEVNNCIFSKSLDVKILASPGSLVYRLPEIVARHIPELSDTVFVYLFDELENLNLSQQKYIQTLIRDKEGNCSIKVGVRTYGIKTYETLGDGEVNREDHEYEAIYLDDELRSIDSSLYRKFALKLCNERLRIAGYPADYNDDAHLAKYFEAAPEYTISKEIRDIRSGKEGETLKKVMRKLHDHTRVLKDSYDYKEEDIPEIIETLSFPKMPLAERAAVVQFYKKWKRGNSLLKSAKAARIEIDSCLDPEIEESDYIKNWISQFKSDLVAQLLRDNQATPDFYCGLDTMVELSIGFPRHLLTVLKYVFQSSHFNGEQPFIEGKISAQSQIEGIRQASRWFLDESKLANRKGTSLLTSISRLSEVFSSNRYSDKPSECSLLTFYVDSTELSEEAREFIQLAADWSLIVRDHKGRRGKSSGMTREKYKLNPMLSPHWGLAVYGRGSIGLKKELVESIFNPEYGDIYRQELEAFNRKRNVPFSGGQIPEKHGLEQRSFFDE